MATRRAWLIQAAQAAQVALPLPALAAWAGLPLSAVAQTASIPAAAPDDDWPAAAFAARSVADALAALGVADVAAALRGAVPGAPAVPGRGAMGLDGPDVAENGASVEFTIACTAPGVQRLALLVAHNTWPLAALVDLRNGTPPRLTTRVKMAQATTVHALAWLADGRVLAAQREVAVIAGGCG